MENDGNTFVLTGLVRKRAELAGAIENAQADLHRMIGELEHLDATIRLFDADYQIEAIKPKTFRPPEDWAKRGQMTRIVLDMLRQAAEPFTTRDIAFQLMRERALDTADLELASADDEALWRGPTRPAQQGRRRVQRRAGASDGLADRAEQPQVFHKSAPQC